YNELARRVNLKSAVLTGLALWNEMATRFDMNTYTSLPQPVVIAVGSCYVLGRGRVLKIEYEVIECGGVISTMIRKINGILKVDYYDTKTTKREVHKNKKVKKLKTHIYQTSDMFEVERLSLTQKYKEVDASYDAIRVHRTGLLKDTNP
nr:hypothetical protein [Tanacetum cinerariifolium]